MSWQKIFFLITVSLITSLTSAAPNTIYHLDELGTSSTTYNLSEVITNKDGEAFYTPSTGNSGGKICSALDFSVSSTSEYAVLDETTLHGANDFTISIWHKGTSTAGRSLLSGARAGQDNALLMWFTNATTFNGYIDGGNHSAINFPSIADNQWHHLVWRRSASQTCFFTDGVQRGCHATTNAALNIESLVLAQEQDNVGGGFSAAQDWEGKLDELLIYRSALSNADILALYNNQNTGKDWDGTIHSCQTTPPAAHIDYSYSDWHFDEDSYNGNANEVVDSHGGFHGSAINAPIVPGKICNAIDLRASTSSDRAILGPGALDGVNDFTISVWHKGSSTKSKSLLSGARSGQGNELIFWYSSMPNPNFHLKTGNGIGTISPSSNITNNQWHHLVWSRQGNQSCYYVDSQLQGCRQSPVGALTIEGLILGQEQDSVGGGFSSAQDWEGILDELIIFRRALNSTAITSIYNNQNAGKNWDGSYRACPNMPNMKLTKTSQVISDPVNATSNPKRIPGAIIRYTIKAQNMHSTMGESVTITDDLNNFISSGKINWVGNIVINSPNTNGGSATNLTDAIDADVGQFSGNILTVECGNISNTAPCILRYEVEIK